MKKTIVLLLVAALAGCSILPEKSPTKLEKSPCACGEGTSRHV